MICCAGGNGSKGGTWNLRKQRTRRPTREERQAGEMIVEMSNVGCDILVALF